MIPRRNGRCYECVAVDLNTQRDFCERDGAYPVANRAELIPALRRIVAWMKWYGAPVISSLDSHRPTEVTFLGHPLCCIDGSMGQQKLGFTMLARHARVEFDNTWSVSLDLFSSFQQLIFRQRNEDLLSNPKADRFLTHVPVHEFVLFGNTLECAVKAVALGLRARNKAVSIVVDACGYWDQGAADLALRQLAAKGAALITTDELLARRLTARLRYRTLSAGQEGQGNGRPHGRPATNSSHKPATTNGNGRSGGNGKARLPRSSAQPIIRPRGDATPGDGRQGGSPT
ncbi:MAG: isochorismatase family protein [Planctomycetes bacterium]|nr:isochorismatase family protein [Planctomycetota bacterium]